MSVINNVKALISTSKLTNLANAIRNKTGEVKSYTVDEMIEKINGMNSSVLTSLNVTTNGIYTPESGVDGFDRVSVDVPIPSGSTTIVQNGTYDVTEFVSAVVDVPDQYFVKQWTEESENLVFCNYWSDKIADRDESAYIYVMKFYGNTHSNGVQLLLYGAREDTKVIAICGNAYRLIDSINYYDPNIYDLFSSAGTIVKVYRIPKTT